MVDETGSPDPRGDKILAGGKIWTGSRHVPAIAIRDGRVLGAGSIEDMRRLVDRKATEIDLEGRRAIPGLIDSHVHFLRAGLNWNELVKWDAVPTLAEGLDLVARAAAELPEGSWLRVLGSWHPGQFAEGRGPTRAELDAAAPGNPVYVQLLYEEAMLNSMALRVAIGETDPPGGVVERDESGAPTGRIRGPGAFQAVLGSIPAADRLAQRASTRAVMSAFNAAGVTGVVDPGGIGVAPESYAPLFDTWRAGEMTLRARLYMVPAERGNEVEQAREWVRYVQPGFGDDWLSYVGMGEILTFGCHDFEGIGPFTVSDDARADLLEITRTLAGAGWNVHMHAVLDDTIGAVLDVWEQVDSEIGLNGRYSLAHAEPIGPRNLARVRDLGVGLGIQDRMLFRAADSAAFWGADVLAGSPPLRDIIDMGIPWGAGTDATVVSPLDPWHCIWWLVTGRSMDGAPARRERHRLTVAEALTAYTAGSAWFSLEEHRRGTLEEGRLADVAVLTEDVFESDPAGLRSVGSALTIVGGRAVWASEAYAGIDR
jgi:predicted amidohydrolase YtcJ